MTSFSHLSVATLNVRGLNANKRQYQLRRLLDAFPHVDIFAIQETKIESQRHIELMLSRYFLDQYEVVVSHASGHSGGVMILIKRCLPYTLISHATDNEGRAALLDALIGGEVWRFLVIYAPNDMTQRYAFFESLSQYFGATGNLVLLGDFNCVLSAGDRSSSRDDVDSSADYLRGIVEAFGMCDAADSCTPSPVQFTHFQGSSHARLDRIYFSASHGHNKEISSYKVHPVYFSDHCLVVATIGARAAPSVNPKSWKLWKMNSKVLQDLVFEEFVIRELAALYSYPVCWAEKWETFKQAVRAFAIERSNIIAYHKMCEENKLKSTLHALLSLEAQNPGQFNEEIKDIQFRLELFDLNRFEGARVRSRTRKFLQGETPNKSYISEERKHRRERLISNVVDGDKTVSDFQDVSNLFIKYYNTLFGASSSSGSEDLIDSFVNEVPRLKLEDSEMLSSDITKAEIQSAITALSSNRSPGPDGLSAEFYKKFMAQLVPILLNVYAEAEARGIFSLSFRRSHTVLVPKKVAEGSNRKVTDYRPITLCNVDYKIFAKVLAARLQSVMPILIGDHQTCAIKTRSIQTNIHVVRTVLDWCRLEGESVAMLQLDLAKAFDRVCHKYLFALLYAVNVGQRFVNYIKMCYEQVATSLIINHTVTAPITLRASVRQGCPLSPLLFDLYLEPLCRRIIRLDDVHGFQLSNAEVKVVAYADDIAFLLRDKPSITKAMKHVELFCMASGAQVNRDKSLGVWCGHWGTTPVKFCGVNWQTQSPRYLGVPLQESRNTNRMWSDRLQGLKRHALVWRQRELSIFERASVCNVFLAARLIYILHVLQCSRKIIHACHRVFATTVWCSTFERMRRENLFRKVKDGGLGLLHLFITQIGMRLSFFRRPQHPILDAVIRALAFNYMPDTYVGFLEPGFQLTGFFKEVVDTMKFLRARFSLEYIFTVSRNVLASHLIETLFPAPFYRQVPADWPGQDVLTRVRNMPIKRNMKSFFFKLHTATLPVKPWLQDKGIYVPWTINCRFCHVPETIDHIFLDCNEALFFWDDIQFKVLKRRLSLNPHTIRFLPMHPDEHVRYDIVMLVVMYCLWKLRMADRHEEPLVPLMRYFSIELRELRLACMQGLDVPEWLEDIYCALSSL